MQISINTERWNSLQLKEGRVRWDIRNKFFPVEKVRPAPSL